jgi:hypothetical protein
MGFMDCSGGVLKTGAITATVVFTHAAKATYGKELSEVCAN